MKAKIIAILVMTLLIGTGTIAIADWDEEDGHKMHWPQLPDPAGWDVFCTAGLSQWPWVVLADDWKCPESGWIKDIHFWGSWWRDKVGIIDHFVIGIAENIPEDPPHNPYSKPGDTLVEWEIYDWIERGPYTGNQGWYWCFEPWWDYDDHQLFWQYNVFLEEEDWFWQDEGEIYWLFISAVVKEYPPDCLWGWKSTYKDLHFMDDAVWAIWYDLYWIPLTYPTGETMDLAFVVTGGEECEPSIDVEKQVKDPDTGAWVDADTASSALDLKICTDAEFKIVIHNDGTCCDLYDIMVYDEMHDSLKFISATPPPDVEWYDPPYYKMEWHFPGPLKPCEEKIIYVTAHVEGPGCSTDSNYVSVVGYPTCPPGIVTDEDWCWVHAKKGKSVDRPIISILESLPNLFPLLKQMLKLIGLYY